MKRNRSAMLDNFLPDSILRCFDETDNLLLFFLFFKVSSLMMELETFKKEKLETEGAQKTAEEQLEVMRNDFEEKVSHCVFVGAFASCRKSAVLLAKLKRFYCLSYCMYKLLFLIFSAPFTLYKYNYQLNFHRKVDKRPRLPGGVATHQLLDY